MELIRQVEAVLFASSNRLTIDEIKLYLDGARKNQIEKALKQLESEYSNKNTSIMLINEEGTWKLSLKPDYMPIVEKLMPSTELPKAVVETLAILAWKAPLLQSDLIHMRSASAYEHITELEKIGLINRVKEGRSYVIKLTEKFFDYFDIPKEAVREIVEKYEDPTIPEQKDENLESEEDRKTRILKEIEENKINPDEIIANDKEFLDNFDIKLDQINKDTNSVELPKSYELENAKDQENQINESDNNDSNLNQDIENNNEEIQVKEQ